MDKNITNNEQNEVISEVSSQSDTTSEAFDICNDNQIQSTDNCEEGKF